MSAALAVAARRWPAEQGNATRLLNRLIEQGRRSIEDAEKQGRQERLAAIERTAGALSGVFGPDALTELREDWPE